MAIKEDYKDVMLVDETGRIEYFSISNVDFFGLSPSALMGTKAHQHYSNLDDETSTLMRAIHYGEAGMGVVQELETANNDIVRQTSDTYCIRRGNDIIGALEMAYYDEEHDLVKNNLHKSSRENNQSESMDDIIGCSARMKQIRKKIKKLVDLEVPVLLLGETGTGKNHVAQILHNSGKRRKHNFVYVNCSAIPENLFESILFGVRKGAFTDAAERDGLFVLADKGTLFLDEIQSMPAYVQSKLLRALEEKRIRAIGGDEEISVDVRVISSAGLDVEALLKSDEMRSDFYFRLAVVQLEMPPLRERKEDIMLLTRYFIDKFNSESRTEKITGTDDETRRFFEKYDWPGNVRELRNVIESAFYTAKDDIIRFEDIKNRFEIASEPEDKNDELTEAFIESGCTLREYMASYTAGCVKGALEESEGDIARAAKKLGISVQMMKYNMKKFSL